MPQVIPPICVRCASYHVAVGRDQERPVRPIPDRVERHWAVVVEPQHVESLHRAVACSSRFPGRLGTFGADFVLVGSFEFLRVLFDSVEALGRGQTDLEVAVCRDEPQDSNKDLQKPSIERVLELGSDVEDLKPIVSALDEDDDCAQEVPVPVDGHPSSSAGSSSHWSAFRVAMPVIMSMIVRTRFAMLMSVTVAMRFLRCTLRPLLLIHCNQLLIVDCHARFG